MRLCVETSLQSVKSEKSVVQIRNPQSAIRNYPSVFGQTQSNPVKPGQTQSNPSMPLPGRRTKFFVSLVGRRCCAAHEFRAERQLCPTGKAKKTVLRPLFPTSAEGPGIRPAIPHIVVSMPECTKYGGLRLWRAIRQTGYWQFPHLGRSNPVKPSQTVSPRNPTECWSAGVLGVPTTPPLHHPITPSLHHSPRLARKANLEYVSLTQSPRFFKPRFVRENLTGKDSL